MMDLICKKNESPKGFVNRADTIENQSKWWVIATAWSHDFKDGTLSVERGNIIIHPGKSIFVFTTMEQSGKIYCLAPYLTFEAMSEDGSNSQKIDNYWDCDQGGLIITEDLKVIDA